MRATNGKRGRGSGRAVLKHRSGWHATINSEIVAVANSGNVAHLIATIQKHLPDMNLVNVTTAIHRLAKLVDSGAQSQTALAGHPVTQALTSAAEARLKSITTDGSAPSCQSLSNIMWSMAVLQIPDWSLLQEVASLTVNYIAYFKPLELSTLLWASAKIMPPETSSRGHWANSVFDAAVDYIRCNVQTFTYRNLITAVGAFATVKKSSPSLFQTVAEQMMKVINTANRLELAKTAWAFGTASVHNDKLFNVVAKHAIPQLQSFQQQELSNLLWGFASNEIFHQELFAKASTCAQRMDLNAQQLANILWAITRMRPQWPVASKTMRALMPRCCEQLPAFKPQELATVAIAAAKVFGHVGEELGRLDESLPSEVANFFVSALPIMLQRLNEFSNQSLANVATAYTAVRAAGVMLLLTQVGQLVLTCLHAYDPPLLLQFMRTFSTDFREFEGSAEQKSACQMVSGALFFQAARALDFFGLEEKRSLAQLCMRYRGCDSDPHAEEEIQQACILCSQDFISNGERDQRVQVPLNTLSLQTALNVEDSPGSNHRKAMTEGSSPTSPKSDYVFHVKNTFLEPVQEYTETPWVSPHVLSKPPLDFLRHKENIQAIRENYQLLKAVPGLDTLSTPENRRPTATDCNLPQVERLDNVPADTSNMSSHVFSSLRQQPSLQSDSLPASMAASVGGGGFPREALQAFRKDYQELRAVPGLDWHTEQGSGHAMSTCLQKHNKRSQSDCLPSPLPFLEQNSEIEALRQTYQKKGAFTAVPGVDFLVSEKAGQSNASGTWLRDHGKDLFDGSTLCEPKALSKPPLDFLVDVGTMHQAPENCHQSKDVQVLAHISNFTTSVGSDPTAAPCTPRRRGADASETGKTQAATLEKAVGSASSSEIGLRSPERHGFESAAIGAFRKDYQELRAVPGLDWKIEGAPGLEQGSAFLYGASARMKQQNRCAELGSLPPPFLPFLEESAELKACRQKYFATGELYAVPGVDFSVPEKCRQTRDGLAVNAHPVDVIPSRWLFDDPLPPLCEPKALSKPPLDFLDDVETMCQAVKDSQKLNDVWIASPTSKATASADSDLPASDSKNQQAATLDNAPGCIASGLDNANSTVRGLSSPERAAFESAIMGVFRKDYQELRAVPGLDWKIEEAPCSEQGSSSSHGASARMQQYNKSPDLGSLPPPFLPFLEESAELHALRQQYFATGEFSAVPGVDFLLPHKESNVDADPRRVTPSRWLFDDPLPPLCEPKAVSKPPLDFLAS